MVSQKSFILILLSSCLVIIFAITILGSKEKVEGTVFSETTTYFEENVSSQDTDKKENIKIILIGDVMLGRSVMAQSIKLNDPIYPLRNVGNKLREADLVFINLENPIIKTCPVHNVGFKFCSLTESVEGLEYAGVDIVNLANNHSQNFGSEGLNQTLNILKDKNISFVGLNNFEIIQIEDLKFGLLGFNKAQETNPILSAEEMELIKDSNRKVDVLIASMHWGIEYKDTPLPGVRYLANELIKLGVDVVAGHHPHWIQGVDCFDEIGKSIYISSQDFKYGKTCPINTKPVFYSLGNFIFDQMWSEETKMGIVVELNFADKFLDNQKVYRTYIQNIGQPEFLDKI